MTVGAVLWPDVEQAAIEHLRTVVPTGVEVTATLKGWQQGASRVTVQRKGGTSQLPYRTDDPRLDVNVYTPTDEEAHDLLMLVRQALNDLPGEQLGSLVVSRVDEFVGPSRLDLAEEEDSARWMWSAALRVRPA